MAASKKRKRKKKVIRTPKRVGVETEVEYLEGCVGAAMEQVDDQAEKIDAIIVKLVAAHKKLRDLEAAGKRYAVRLDKAREAEADTVARGHVSGGIKGNGELVDLVRNTPVLFDGVGA